MGFLCFFLIRPTELVESVHYYNMASGCFLQTVQVLVKLLKLLQFYEGVNIMF